MMLIKGLKRTIAWLANFIDRYVLLCHYRASHGDAICTFCERLDYWSGRMP